MFSKSQKMITYSRVPNIETSIRIFIGFQHISTTSMKSISVVSKKKSHELVVSKIE